MSTDPDLIAAKREIKFARLLGEPTPVTWWLFISNIVFWIAAFAGGLYLNSYTEMSKITGGASADLVVFYTGMKVVTQIEAGDWWRTISSMWVHLGFTHIGFNAYGIFVIGPLLERFLGWRRFFSIYMIAGIAGSVASTIFSDVPSGGASGALYGLIGALIVVAFKHRSSLPPHVYKALTTGMAPWIILSIGIGFLDAVPFDNAAHIGGILGGAFAVAPMRTKLSSDGKDSLKHLFSVFCIFCFVLLIVTAWFWSIEINDCLNADAYLQCYPELRSP